ncbi:MAG: UDP-N-acetylmuramoyl-tripeptide--D-alanyl-D-alanine ligase [Planctomycetota bacterium]|nr:MAG: UDP-N-acetylmuramoyl-tripeptide--D-alanyl-D-alanine ligase [Planctomycetota bacterium]
MDPLRLEHAAKLVGGQLRGEVGKQRAQRVVIDSREVRPGDLFVCIKGDRFDGHEFATTARAAGAIGVLTERELPGLEPQIVVGDSLAALGALGHAVRVRARKSNDPIVVAVTGTNGKTGTKDLTAGALGSQRRTVASPGSYNNSVGVPLSLLGIENDSEAVVVEAGSNAPGEIASLAQLVEPEIGVITNCQTGHLEGLGDLEGVRQEKGSLLDGLVGRAVSVLNRDDPSFAELAARAPGEVVSFGLDPAADVRAENVRCDLESTRFVVDGKLPVRVAHLGHHAVLNALAALAVARVMGLDLRVAALGMGRIAPPPGRLQLRRVGQITVLDDSYNANPGSLAAAARTVAELGHDSRRVCIVGDMLELGRKAKRFHREAGRALGATLPAQLVAVGRYAAQLVEGAVDAGMPAEVCYACADRSEAAQRMADMLRPGDLVLLKASRGMALERLFGALASQAAAAP